MAEVEMEQDASRRVAFGAGMDEDLINYESDTADKHDVEDDTHWDQMPTGDDDVKDEAELLALDTTLVDVEGTDDHADDGAPLSGSKNPQEQYSLIDDKGTLSVPVETQGEEVPIEDQQQDENENENENGDEVGAEAEDPKDLDDDQLDLFAPDDHDTEVLEQSFDADVRSEGEAEGAHEIDYDMNDPDANVLSENQGDLSLADDLHEVEDTALAQSALSAKDDYSADQEQDFDDTEHQVEDDGEITWEEGETTALNKNAASGAEEKNSPQAEEALSPDHEAHTDEGVQKKEVQVIEEDKVEEGNGLEDHTEVGSDRHSNPMAGHASGDESATSPRIQLDLTTVHSESDDQEFPAITVQYKGDEFPFFSGSSEGFFTEAAVLDDNMKSLMDGFRAELTNEIASDEELVFQVDELGLEFSESSLNEALSGITLRQILEVFDLLVKNQDPDSSRVLYTYLFTRPSTSKRFESLIESATAGKGLDEVIHLFASPMPHGNRVIIEETHAEENYDEDLDTYESAEDTVESDEGNTKEASNEQATEEFDYEAREAELDTGALSDSDSKPQTLVSHNDEEPDLVLPSTTDTLMEAEESEQPGLEEASHTHDNADLNEQDGSVPDVSEHEASQEANMDDVQSVHGEIAADQLSSDSEVAHPTATDTSTTNTLEDDAGARSSAADAELDFTADHEFSQEVLDEQDELAEIDWRHEADAADEPADGAQAASKRPRTDDEPGMDDEKDVKRLRS